MRAASPALLALLATNQFYKADLYTITLNGGAVLRYTTFDQALSYGGNTFDAIGAPLIERSGMKSAAGFSVDDMSLTISADAGITINSVPLMAFIRGGGLDGALVQLDFMYMATPGDTSAGPLLMFLGDVGEVSPSRTRAIVTVKAWLNRLSTMLPTRVYQAGCMHTLFDGNCGLSRASFKVSKAAQPGCTASALQTNVVNPTGYLDLGTVKFTSGANSGVSRTIKSQVGGVLSLVYPLPSIPASGDTFDAYPGCDHMQATCSGKFSNLPNFKGTPFVPVAETSF